jgi:hypothetical protein
MFSTSRGILYSSPPKDETTETETDATTPTPAPADD